MIKNVGGIDRLIRGLLGVLLIVGVFFIDRVALKVVSGIVGIVFLGTAVVGFCPLYKVFGLSTCPLKKEESK